MPAHAPPEVLGLIYKAADPATQFALSRVSGWCRQLWQRDLIQNVGALMGEQWVFGYTQTDRKVKCDQRRLKKELTCITFHVGLSADVLGQFLSLPHRHRCTVASGLVDRLSEELDWVLTSRSYCFLTVLVKHNADLKPRDFVALQDLLWTLPWRVRRLDGITGPWAMDVQWWLWSSACSAKHPISWDVGELAESCWHEAYEPRHPEFLDRVAEFE